jgi:hypothetical protein
LIDGVTLQYGVWMDELLTVWNNSRNYQELLGLAYPRSSEHDFEFASDRLVISERRARLVSCACCRIVMGKIADEETLNSTAHHSSTQGRGRFL